MYRFQYLYYYNKVNMNNLEGFLLQIFIFLIIPFSCIFILENKRWFSNMCFILKKKNISPWTKPKALPLPPGSMGWPYIGETLHLYSQDPNFFFTDRQTRYGEIFKTNILGCPCVMLSSPEAARFVLVTEAHLFKPTYPKGKETLIGPSAIFFHQGDNHTRLRKLVQCALYPEAIRGLVGDIEAIAASALDSWAASDHHVTNTFQAMKKFSFEVGILAIFGHLDTYYKEELRKNYSIVDNGYNCFPIKLPGTSYKRALEARKRLGEIIREIINQRKEERRIDKDLLGCLLNWKNDKDEIKSEDEIIADNIIGALFAAQDTTASAMTWILKYLHDNPKLLEIVKAEQMDIFLSNVEGNGHLTWAQTKNSMPTTNKVMLESLRMASIISFAFREAVEDVEYKGYLIPKGWKVMPLFRNIHHNPNLFADPHKFDPSRFQVAPKPNTFLPFGNGVHACPGNELAKLEMLVMIHHLVCKFRWEVVGSKSGVQYSPFPIPLHGLPARLWREPTNYTKAA